MVLEIVKRVGHKLKLTKHKVIGLELHFVSHIISHEGSEIEPTRMG